MNKVVFGILTILFNSIGVPCFIAGKTKAGIVRIILDVVLSFVCIGVIFAIINGIAGIIQGIKILCMSNEEFEAADKATLLAGVPSGKPKAEADAE